MGQKIIFRAVATPVPASISHPISSHPNNTSYSLSMAEVKTRRHSASKLSEFVGPTKEFLPSEVPTLRAIIQRGLLVRDRLLLEQGSAKTEIHTKDIIAELVPLISTQWQMSNGKFSPPVTIKEDSIRKKVERLWGRV